MTLKKGFRSIRGHKPEAGNIEEEWDSAKETALGGHFDSAEQFALVTFVTDGETRYYVPKGTENRLGPIVIADEYTNRWFGPKRQDTHILFDPGTDDFPAAIYVMAQAQRFRLLSLTAGFGNVHPDVTLQNARMVVALTGRFDIPVYKGAQFPLGGVLPEDAVGEHGQDGLGGARPFNYDKIVKPAMEKVTVKEDGPSFIAQDVLRRHKRKDSPALLISVGSLTDVHRVLELIIKEDAEALGKVRLSIMGGGVALQRWHTNVTPFAEFNCYQDPKAARETFEIVRTYGVPSIIAPLDVTHQTSVSALFEGRHLEEAAARDKNPVADMMSQLFSHVGSFDRERSMDIYQFSWRRRFMHDINAASALVKPELYTGFAGWVEVTEEGEERGKMTAHPDTHGNCFVIVGCNPRAIVNHWLETFVNYQGGVAAAGANRL